MAVTCSKCKAAVTAGRDKCPRCGAKLAVEAPDLVALLKGQPWLIVLLTVCVLAALWAAKRRAPPPPAPIPADMKPVAERAPAVKPAPAPGAP